LLLLFLPLAFINNLYYWGFFVGISSLCFYLVSPFWLTFNLDYYKPLGNPTKFIHAMLTHFSRCKDEEIYPEQYLEYAEKQELDLDSKQGDEGVVDEVKRLKEISNAYHVYQQLLLDNNALDFGDLINYTLKLFTQRKNILKKYQEQFDYILVDEFQDTNFAQYNLVKLLAGDKKNLTVVADDDQSIYKFRGASVSNRGPLSPSGIRSSSGPLRDGSMHPRRRFGSSQNRGAGWLPAIVA